jgi:uncharacterized membrane protein (DUF485 family)
MKKRKTNLRSLRNKKENKNTYMNFFSFADSVLVPAVPAFPSTFLAIESFFLSASGLFDFDLTFAAEAILFIILAFVVTSVYLNPIAKQIDDRNEFVNKNLLESYFTLAIGHQNISESVKILLLEIEELTRQVKLVKDYTNSEFDEEILALQTENTVIVNELKGELAIKSAYILNSVNTDLLTLASNYVSKKFSQ